MSNSYFSLFTFHFSLKNNEDIGFKLWQQFY